MPRLCYNRGNVLRELRRHDESLAAYDQAIAIKPTMAEALSNRANVLRDLRRLDEALAACDQAIAAMPDLAEAHCNRGNVLGDLRRHDDALASYDRAVAIKPDYAEVYSNRGNVLRELKRYDEALTSYERAVAIKPDLPYLPGSLLHTRMLICDWGKFDDSVDQIIRSVEAGKKVATPFEVMVIPSSSAQQLQCARVCTEDKFPAAFMAAPGGGWRAHDRIRLAYFSSDFKDHPVSHLTAGLIEHHDRARFEVLAFSLGRRSGDDMQRRLRQAFDRFVDCGERTDREIALLARSMEIDVAVDLNGHTFGARTGVFALRAAPVQVNFLGYPGTMGANYLDYIIADETVIPPNEIGNFAERVVYLPHTFQVNDCTKIIADRQFSRGERGLPEEGFVFCCFNNNYKITPDVFATWMRLLRAVSGSVLWLFGGAPAAVRNLRKEAGKHGISPDRLVFAGRLELAEYLAQYRLADLFLDTWHYNAGTTASDALWAGLPVLTCLGRTFAGRMAASLLKAVGLPELIARSHEEYESTAIALAKDRGRLTEIRETLARHRTTYPLFDTALFTKQIEAAYLTMVARAQANLPPLTFRVEA